MIGLTLYRIWWWGYFHAAGGCGDSGGVIVVPAFCASGLLASRGDSAFICSQTLPLLYPTAPAAAARSMYLCLLFIARNTTCAPFALPSSQHTIAYARLARRARTPLPGMRWLRKAHTAARPRAHAPHSRFSLAVRIVAYTCLRFRARRSACFGRRTARAARSRVMAYVRRRRAAQRIGKRSSAYRFAPRGFGVRRQQRSAT